MLPPPLVIVHVTAVLVAPVTVLVNVVLVPSWTLADGGEIVTTTGGGVGAVKVTAATAEADGVDTEVARTETEAEEGIVAGAV